MSPGPFEVEVLSCEVGAGAIEVEASLTNLSRERRSYTVYGVVRRPGGIPDLVADVAAVDAGATVPLTLRRTSRAEAHGTCDVHLVVHGPTPYGLDMERIND